LGIAKAAAGDRAGARSAYLKAIGIDENFLPAQLNLGKLELLEGNRPAARARFQGILKTRPKDTQPMYELAQLEVAAGNLREAVRWLEKAHALDRRNTKITMLLVQLQLKALNVDAALNVAKETQSAVPDNLEAMSALGQAYGGAGKIDLARASFERM